MRARTSRGRHPAEPPDDGAPGTTVHPPADAAPGRTTRRTVLRGAALTTAAVGLAGLGIRGADQGVLSAGKGPAYEAWHALDGSPGIAQTLVGAAVLAANPHNMQAWQLVLDDLEQPTRVEIHDDTTRSLGAVDPVRREAHLGLGCAAANVELAAAALGRPATLQWWPEGPHGPAVVATLAAPGRADPATGAADPLWAAVPRRRSDRGAYPDPAPSPDELAAALGPVGADPAVTLRWFTTTDQRERLGTLLVDAARALTQDTPMSLANDAWFRSDWDAVQRHKDGLTLDAQAMPGLVVLAAKMLPGTPRAQADASWVQRTRDVHTRTAAAYLALEVADRTDPAAVTRAGRTLQRVHLALTAHGFALQHLNQALEMRDRQEATGRRGDWQARVGAELGAGAVAVVRMGHASGGAGPSPRRPWTEVLA